MNEEEDAIKCMETMEKYCPQDVGVAHLSNLVRAQAKYIKALKDHDIGSMVERRTALAECRRVITAIRERYP